MIHTLAVVDFADWAIGLFGSLIVACAVACVRFLWQIREGQIATNTSLAVLTSQHQQHGTQIGEHAQAIQDLRDWKIEAKPKLDKCYLHIAPDGKRTFHGG